MADFAMRMILSATKGRLAGGPAPEALHGVSTDTRTITPGALFVALRGESFDGHSFVGQAFSRGAGAALVAREVEAAGPLIVVADTLIALGALAKAHRLARRSPSEGGAAQAVTVLAITGSTGKTTTKEMIASILAQGWRTAKTPGNFNNEIGVPLALLGLESSHRAAVIELAMRGRGQIAYLADMARPQIGVITNIGFSHLELLGSREAIAETKAELLQALPADGAAVLNADNEFFPFLKARSPARVISIGQHPDADVRVGDVVIGEDGGVSARLKGWWGEEQVHLRAAGRHQALNAAAAAAAAMAAGAQPEWIAPGLQAFETADMRGEIVKAPGGYTVIADCYNAAPDSMRVALELLADLPGRRKWAVLGDMKELGAMTEDWHREVGAMAAASGIAGLITVGELGRLIAEGARGAGPPTCAAPPLHVEAAGGNASAAAAIRKRLEPGDVVLVKGSRAMKMEEIVAALLESKGVPAHG